MMQKPLRILSVIIGSIATISILPFSGASALTQNNLSIQKRMSNASNSVIHLKFEDSAEVMLSGNSFVSGSGENMTEVNKETNLFKVVGKQKLFAANPNVISLQKKNLERSNKANLPNLNSYFYLTLRSGQNIESIVERLKRIPYIADAYAAPLPDASPTSPDYSHVQSHLRVTSDGLNLNAARLYPGVSGGNVAVADIEYEWNIDHEDLVVAREVGAFIANGTPQGPFNDNSHGTAVAGILSGERNSFGINGIVSDSKLHLINSYNTERGWDIANAVYLAQANMQAGDVILIEQQVSGPAGTGKYVPVEWIPAVYDVIQIAVAKGIHVIEAAGNGSENLDDPLYGSTFPAGKPDSGAIIVGAGSACAGSDPRTRLNFSTYGSRVNVQNYGKCVTTSGYGALYADGGQNAFYTDSFSGTSSAAAITAGIVAALSSSYEEQHGVPISPADLRSLLVATGSPQDKSIDSSHIGPLPNILAALDTFTAVPPVDSSPPTAPTALTASEISDTQLQLNWGPSSDNTDVASYDVYRNSTVIATVYDTTFIDTGLQANTTYNYFVTAKDIGGDEGDGTDVLYVSTLQPPDTAPPSTPTALVATPFAATQIDLSWNASTDNVAVSSYDIFRNGSVIASVQSNTYSDTGLSANVRYTYYVRAKDAAGNYSGISNAAYATTPQPPDTIAPVVSILSPSSGSSLGNSTTISISASDNQAVSRLELYIDGQLVSTTTNSTTLVYNWNTKKVARGNHTIMAKAFDTAGNSSQATISVKK